MNFWDVHGVLFLVCFAFFPRLTMLFATAHPVGLLQWLGWLFVPRFVAAILATSYFWDTNPVLCILTWLVALGRGSASAETARRAAR